MYHPSLLAADSTCCHVRHESHPEGEAVRSRYTIQSYRNQRKTNGQRMVFTWRMRDFPTASISSMKMMQGASFRAFAKRSRTCGWGEPRGEQETQKQESARKGSQRTGSDRARELQWRGQRRQHTKDWYPSRSHSNEHLHKVGARNAEERNIRLACRRFREQRFASAGRTDKQRAL